MGTMEKLLSGLESFVVYIGKRLMELDRNFDFKD